MEEEDGGEETNEVLDDNVGEVNLVVDEMPQISIHALHGVHTYQTMKVNGKAGNANLHILIDLGSTHTFLHSC